MDIYNISSGLKPVVDNMKRSNQQDIKSFGSAIAYICENKNFKKVLAGRAASAYKGDINIDGLGIKSFLLKEMNNGESSCLTLVADDLSICKSLLVENNCGTLLTSDNGATKKVTFKVTKRGIREIEEHQGEQDK